MRPCLAAAVLVACVVCGGLQAIAGEQHQRRALAGRPLADALRDLQARGLRIVFSSTLVRRDMRVVLEPRSAGDRQVLDEILKPHGLEARPGPGANRVVVRARASEGAAPAPARTGATIRGVVVDADSATPLPGVIVRLANAMSDESVTDEDGRFELTSITPGRHTLFASLVGYTLARPEIDVAAATMHEYTVALAGGTATYSEEITVTADPFRGREPPMPTAMALTSADLLELRGALSDDPLRAVQALPAVMAANDFRSEFSVRGSDYRHIGLSVDGMATEWPIHTVHGDAGGGSVTLINSDVVDQVTLFSGAYPQERPARTGAWIDFTIREGARARVQVRGALSMTSASLILEGPIGRASRGSWLVATRQSYIQWVLKRMGSDGSTAFGFTDIQGKAVYDVSPAQRLDATVIAGRSRLDLRRLDTDPNLVGRGAADAVLLTAGWRAVRGSTWTIEQRGSASRYGFGNDRLDAVPLAEGTGDSVAYRGAVSWMPRPSSMLQVGTHVQRDSADQSMTRFIELATPAGAAPRQQLVRGSRAIWSADARVSHSASRLGLDAGALVSRATNDAAPPGLSPWLAVTVPLSGALSFRTAGGIYRQHPGLDQTRGTFGRDDVRAERATQFDVTLEHRWRPDTRVQVTAYSRREREMLRLGDDEYRLVGGAITPPSLTPRWANALDGSSLGVEVLVQRRSATGSSGWLAYGYSRTRHDDRQRGERFDADFDQRHTFSGYAQYRVSPVTSLSAKLRVGSNFPIPGYLEARGDELYVGERRNTVRLPSYARLDLRGNRAFNFDARRLTLFVEMVNLLGRTNYAPGYDAMRVLGDGRIVSATQRLFPFLPTAGLLVEF